MHDRGSASADAKSVIRDTPFTAPAEQGEGPPSGGPSIGFGKKRTYFIETS
jgi:hypothetical protein